MKNYLLGTKVVHAPLNGLQEGDTAMASLCRPGKVLLGGVWVSGGVTCGVCKQRITSAHVMALALNEAYNQGVVDAEVETELSGDPTDDFLSYSDQDLTGGKAYHAKHMGRFLTQDVTTWRNRLTSVTYHAKRLTLVNAEIARRKLVHDVAAAEAEAWELHKLIDFAEKLSSRPPMPLAEAEQLYAQGEVEVADLMVTENNYGEQGPRAFTTCEWLRGWRAQETKRTLVEGIVAAGRPMPSKEELEAAVVALDHTEAIEEDRARFSHSTFTWFLTPVQAGHRLNDGTIERVTLVASDVSRTVHDQNMVLIARDNGMVQPVPEGTLTS